MRTRFLLTSAATAALITSVAIPSAHAQQSDFLESKAPWGITQVAGDGSRNAYCAMAKKFGPDVILTIARNLNSESSFAIDFQGPRFAVSKAVDVVLDPGAGQQRNYKLQPVSSTAFVVRLGNDTAFFDALKKTGYLRFEIDQKSYSFNLADVDAGDTKLDACVAASVLPAAGDPATPGTAAPVSPVQQNASADDSSYRQEINALRNDVKNLQMKNDEMAQRMSPDAPVPVAAAPLFDPSKVLSERIATLETNNRQLQAQLDQARSQKIAAAPVQSAPSAADSKILNDLRADNAQMKNQLSAMQTTQGDMAALRTENAHLQQANATSAAQNSNMVTLQTQLKDAQTQNAAMTQKINGQGQISGTIAQLSDKVAALETENKNLQTQLATAEADTKNLQGALDAKAQGANNEAANLRAENARLITAMNEQKSLLEKQKPVLASAAQLTQSNKDLQGQLSSAQANEKTLQGALDAKAQGANNEAASLRAENARLITAMNDQKSLLEKQKPVLASAAQLTQSNKDLQGQLSLAQANEKTMQGALDAKAQGAKDETATLRAENARLQASLDTQKTEEVTDKTAQSDMVTLLQDNKGLQAQIAEIQQQKSGVVTQMQTLDEENRRLKEQLAKTEKQTAQLASLQQNMADITQENKHLKAAAEENQALAPVKMEPSLPASKLAVQPMSALDNDMPAASFVATPAIEKTNTGGLENNLMPQAGDAGPVEKIDVHDSENPDAQLKSPDNFSAQTSFENKKSVALLQEQPKKQPLPATQTVAATPINAKAMKQAITNSSKVENAAGAKPPSDEKLRAPRPVLDPVNFNLKNITASELRVRRKIMAQRQMSLAQNLPDQNLQIIAQPEVPRAILPTATPVYNKTASTFPKSPQQKLASVAPALQKTAEAKITPALSEKSHTAPLSKTATPEIYHPSVSVEAILSGARIPTGKPVELVAEASDRRKAAYQWKASELYGSAVQEPLTNKDSFDDQVKNYLEKTQSRCAGDFAVTPDDTKQVGDKRADSYEIACVSPTVNSAASLVFFSIDGTFTAVAHEAPTMQLETAMEMRDRVMREVIRS